MMDYDEAITAALASLKQNTRVIQPYRNYAIKHLMEAQADIHMGLTTTNRRPPVDFLDRTQATPAAACICRDGMPARKDCPVHGTH